MNGSADVVGTLVELCVYLPVLLPFNDEFIVFKSESVVPRRFQISSRQMYVQRVGIVGDGNLVCH